MSAIDLNDYIAAGYFITKYATDGWWKSPIMPERVISLSGCIANSLEIFWGWDIEKHRQETLDFGIPADKLDAFKQWSNGEDIGHPNVIYTLNTARQFVAEFLPAQDDVLIVGTALPKDLVDEFLTDNKQRTFDTKNQIYLDTLFGSNRVLADKKPLPNGGEIRGFEILCYWHHICDSWLCSNIEKDMHKLFGIHPNQFGLIDTYEEAKKVNDWIAEDEHRGEPLPYYPWLLVQYPLI